MSAKSLTRKPPNPKWGLGLLLAALLCGVSLRVVNTMGKVVLHHDEAIAYLASTGHMGEFARVTQTRTSPYGDWTQASEWKRFTRTERMYCFRTIGADLSKHDIHPPLYFWLLHVWGLYFGIDVWTGPALNVLLSVFTTIALFFLGRAVWRNATHAGVVTFLWSVSAGVIPASFYARPYELAALCTTLFCWSLVRLVDSEAPPGRRHFVGLTLATAMGMLTHYHFAIVVAGGAMLVTLRFATRDRRRLAKLAASTAAGLVLFVLLHPGFLNSIKLSGVQSQSFAVEGITFRLQRIATTYSRFFLDRFSLGIYDHYYIEFIVLPIFGVACVFAIVKRMLRRRRIGTTGQRSPSGIGAVIFLLVWMAAINGLLYVGFVSPRHAMAPRYLSLVWPFFAFAVVLLLQSLGRGRQFATGALCLLVFVGGVFSVHLTHYREGAVADPTALLDSTDWILVDEVRRGTLPRVLWRCPDDVVVYVAAQNHFVENPSEWIHGREGPGLYINAGSSDVPRDWLILRPLSQQYNIKEVPGLFWDLCRAYQIAK